MSQKKTIQLTLIQIAVGCVITLIGSMFYLLFFNKLIWQIFLKDTITHGFWVGLLLLISIAVSYGLMILGVTEGIRFVGRYFGHNIPFKPVCSGAFLGAPAIVGLLALLNIPWEIFGTRNIILKILIPIFEIIAFILSLPVRVWLLLGIPVIILYVLAIPIGAIVGYRLSNMDEVEVIPQET